MFIWDQNRQIQGGASYETSILEVQVSEDRRSLLSVRHHQEFWWRPNRLRRSALSPKHHWNCGGEEEVPTQHSFQLCLHGRNQLQPHHRKCGCRSCGFNNLRAHRPWKPPGTIWTSERASRSLIFRSFLGCNGCVHFSTLELHCDKVLHWLCRSARRKWVSLAICTFKVIFHEFHTLCCLKHPKHSECRCGLKVT